MIYKVLYRIIFILVSILLISNTLASNNTGDTTKILRLILQRISLPTNIQNADFILYDVKLHVINSKNNLIQEIPFEEPIILFENVTAQKNYVNILKPEKIYKLDWTAMSSKENKIWSKDDNTIFIWGLYSAFIHHTKSSFYKILEGCKGITFRDKFIIAKVPEGEQSIFTSDIYDVLDFDGEAARRSEETAINAMKQLRFLYVKYDRIFKFSKFEMKLLKETTEYKDY